MREVAIISAGMTRFGELWESSLRDLFAEAALEALRAVVHHTGVLLGELLAELVGQGVEQFFVEGDPFAGEQRRDVHIGGRDVRLDVIDRARQRDARITAQRVQPRSRFLTDNG